MEVGATKRKVEAEAAQVKTTLTFNISINYINISEAACHVLYYILFLVGSSLVLNLLLSTKNSSSIIRVLNIVKSKRSTLQKVIFLAIYLDS